MEELTVQFFPRHDQTFYHSAIVVLAIIINGAALAFCRQNKTVQSKLFSKHYMLPYFGLGVFSCIIDLIPSELSHFSATYVQLLVCLICTILLVNASVHWTRRLAFLLPLTLIMIICSYLSLSSGLLALLLLGVFSLLCYGLLLIVYIAAYKRSHNFGYMFYTVAVALLCLGSLSHIWLALEGDLESAAELFAATAVCGFCLAGVGYILVLEHKEQSKLLQLVLRDPLTELLNRRGMDEAFSQANNAQGNWSLLVIDIDHFKSINDRFGHDIGDMVIQKVANALRTCCRTNDVLCRIGGEEFVVILFDADRHLLQSIAERIRLHIAGTTFAVQNQKIQVTVSIGAVISEPSGLLQEHIKLADKALYQAKADGRNRVVYAND